jgi:hypothetical protein
MMLSELARQDSGENWDAQQTLEDLSDQLHVLVPENCCVHGEHFCLSCGLAWVVEQDVPLHLDPES